MCAYVANKDGTYAYTDYAKIRDTIAPYVEGFTKEFTSKWGDRWTITSDEVMAWLNSKGYKKKEDKKKKAMA